MIATSPKSRLHSQVLNSNTGAVGLFNWGSLEIDRLTDASSNEFDPATRLFQKTEALQIAKLHTMLPPMHQQTIAWNIRDDVRSVLQPPANKARHWLTVMRP